MTLAIMFLGGYLVGGLIGLALLAAFVRRKTKPKPGPRVSAGDKFREDLAILRSEPLLDYLRRHIDAELKGEP